MTRLLEVNDLTVSYGAAVVVDNCTLGVSSGEIVGLIGPNGAGKTSAIDAISGFVPAAGRVSLDGVRVEHVGAHERARRGMVRTFQSVELFDGLNVLENITIGRPKSNRTERRSRTTKSLRPDVAELLDEFAVMGLLEADVSTLSTGQRKVVMLARALETSPRLLLLDEPAAGLDSHESGRLGTLLRALAKAGLGVLVVEHDMRLVFGMCDHLEVLEFGRQIASGTPDEVASDPVVSNAYLGSFNE